MMTFLKNIGVVEVILVESILFAGLWAMNAYIAKLLTIILVPIFSAILVIALISEMLEKSKVPRKFFTVLGVAALIPLIIMAIVILLER